jgi:excisionase family DNA binding protein
MPKEIMGITMYSMTETAKIIGVTTRTVSTYLKSGKLAGSKIGGRWHFTEKQIQDYITQGSISKPITQRRK